MRRTRSLTARALALAVALMALLAVAAPQPSLAATRKLPLAVVAKDYRFLGVPSTLPAGTYDTRFFNVGDEFHVLVAINLGPTCSRFTNQQVIDLADRISELPEEEGDAAFADACPGGSFAGAVAAPPGGQDRQDLTFTPGRVYYFCPVPTEEGIPHSDLGMRGFINVRSVPVR